MGENENENENENESESGVWSWVLQELAMSDLVDLRLLYGLMESAPPRLWGDASEAVAFGCLQALSASASASVDTPSTNKELHFPLSVTSQRLLNRIYHQTDNFRKDASEELKSSIHAFVNLKKPTLPTSSLELLKNRLLQGNQPSLDDLQHCSGLYTSPNSAENLQQQLDPCSPTPEINGHLPHVYIADATLEHSKSNTNGCYIDNHIHGIDNGSDELDTFAPLGKKLKLQKQPLHSVSSDDIHEDSNHALNKANHSCGGDLSEKNIIGQPNTSTKNDDLHQIGATMSSAIFSGTQYVFNEVPIPLTDSEPNLCMKCNEAGQLLSCSGSTCPLLFHKNCLGGFVDFYDDGSFYCPICAYASAASDYVIAKDKMSFTRKQLTLFIGGESANKPTHDYSRSLDIGMDQQRHENRENVTDGVQNGADGAQAGKPH